MSLSSSDLGEEIRKLQEEQKASDSRRASLYSQSAAVEPQIQLPIASILGPQGQRSRNVSTSSYANSIVEVNSAARYGGYSPYSPIGSLRSGSWSQVSHPMSSSGPMRSMSRRSSKFGMMSTPETGAICESPKEERHAQAIEDNSSIQHTPRPSSKSNVSNPRASMDSQADTRDRRMKRLSTGRLPSDGSFSELYNQLAEANRQSMEINGTRVVSDTSFTDIYDQIAGGIKDDLDKSVIAAQEREMKRQSIAMATPPALLPPFAEPQTQSSKPFRLSETPPPLPPQHKELPQAEVEAQEDYGINFSFTGSLHDQNGHAHDEEQRPMQLHVPRDDYSFDDDDRPYTANSQDTFQQAEHLFQDFDGTHYAPSMMSRYNSLRETIRDPSGGSGFPLDDPNRSSMLKALPEESVTSLIPPPPPEDGMVYYPAPVPRMLNLPQRISQAPSAAAMAKRKTQVINALPDEARRSAYWLPQAPGTAVEPQADARASKLNLAALPPQLRASVFFDPGSQRRDIEIRDQSAVRTLDDLLDASALAPVSAFTDHPIVGKTNVYKKSQDPRVSTLDLRPPPAMNGKKDRKGSFMGFGRRSSVGAGSELGLEDRGRSVSPGRPMHFDDSALARGPDGELLAAHSGRSSPELDPNGVYGDLRDPDASDEEGGVPLDAESESEEEVGAPTTLLAELELRKREQKNRNRTAYTAFPDGMHATLLELDDVAQLQKAKRKKTRVALAWEDPALKARDDAGDGDDDDVPLGVLYANDKNVQQMIKERDLAEGRPLGLMEKKELEDNEPLSKRMLRLRGINPNYRPPPSVAIMNPEGGEESESEHEGETLGQRMKRLRDKKALDEAIGDVEGRPVSEAFSVDVLSQLGVKVEGKDKENGRKTPDGLHSRQVSTGSAPKSPGGGLLPPSRSNATTPGTGSADEEETLGQRRARLQREATQAAMQRRASGLSIPTLNPNARMSSMNLATQSTMDLNGNAHLAPTPARTPPPLQKRVSMADILAAYPTGKNDARKVSNDMLLANAPATSLLAKDAEEKATRAERMRMSSAEMLGGRMKQQQARPDFLRQQSQMTQMTGVSGMSGGSGVGGMWTNQQQLYGMWSSQSNAMMNMHMQGYGYPNSAYGLPSPNYGTNYNYNPMSVYGAQLGTQMGSGNSGYQQSIYGGGVNGMAQYNGGYGNMQTGMGQPEGFIDQKTRSRVDAWRQSVTQ